MSNKATFVLRELLAAVSLGQAGAAASTHSTLRKTGGRPNRGKGTGASAEDASGRPSAPLVSIAPFTPRCW
jgi:hypothetical protein